MKKILFITQNLDRTGSEMVLWYLLNHLDKKNYSIYVFCIKKGELYDLLPPEVKKGTPYREQKKWHLSALRAIVKITGRDPLAYQLEQIQASFKADLWYVNTLAIPQVHPIAKELNVKIVTHFHEYLFAYTFIKDRELKNIIDFSAVTIGCSELVCQKLKELGHKDVKLQYSFIDEKLIQPNEERIKQLKSKHGILDTDFVWVISGKTTYLKGLDYVLSLMDHFKENSRVKILWIGGKQQTGLDYFVQHVAKEKYVNKLIFTDSVTADYYNYFSIASAYLSLSREECLSLAMLEAAFLEKPIVSFATGITRQFVKEGMGFVTEIGDIKGIISAMEYLHEHPNQKTHLLRKAALEFTVGEQIPKYKAILELI